MSPSPSLNSVLISFSELVTAHITQTLSFHLPSNSGSASVITPLIQKEVADAVLAAITSASGQAPSNMTIVPIFSTSSSDGGGSITISFLIDATLSKIVNTTIFISAVAYANDPVGSTAIAIKSATGGSEVQSAAASLTTAATSVCALVNATTSATTTTNSLVSRIANVIQKNASSITATAVCAKDAIISTVFGVFVSDSSASGSSATSTAGGGLSITDILQSGGVAGLIGALIAFFIMYTIARRSSNMKKKKNTTATASSRNHTKVKRLQTQNPRPPKGIPPKHAFTSFQQSHSENPGSVSSSDSSLSLATTVNPLRRGEPLQKR